MDLIESVPRVWNSSRKITDQLFEKIGIENIQQKLTTLRALDKIERLGWNNVKQLLSDGRKDKSGDYTKGANLSSENIEYIEKELKNLDGNNLSQLSRRVFLIILIYLGLISSVNGQT